MRGLIAVAALAALGGCGSAPAPHGISRQRRQEPLPGHRLETTGRPSSPRTRTPGCATSSPRRATVHTLTNVTSSNGRRLPGRDRRARPDRHRDGARGRRAARGSSSRSIRRRTSSRSTTPSTPRPASTSSAAASTASPSTSAGRSSPVEVGYQCSYAPIPFFSSSAGWGLRIASQNPAGARVPRLAGRPGLPGRGRPAVHASRRSPTAPRSASRRPGSTSASTSARSPGRSPTTRPRPGRPSIPPPSQLELIKWRDVVDRPGRGARGRDAAPGGEDPDRLGAARQPLGALQRRARPSTRGGSPTPPG